MDETPHSLLAALQLCARDRERLESALFQTALCERGQFDPRLLAELKVERRREAFCVRAMISEADHVRERAAGLTCRPAI